ncbi:MAG: hypothetical protein CSB44_10395 [Gammaproteobacteria bacterium]|nr:MAG: hypothetical protein CSB44_10395 [Gammaproteobacteria bacterium]PIE35526.1 MAG: hypothetical protein CSA54_05420 [Gammaproteobacteria bacterium]
MRCLRYRSISPIVFHAARRSAWIRNARNQLDLNRLLTDMDSASLSLYITRLEILDAQVCRSLPSEIRAVRTIISGRPYQRNHRSFHGGGTFRHHEHIVPEGIRGASVDLDQHGVKT